MIDRVNIGYVKDAHRVYVSVVVDGEAVGTNVHDTTVAACFAVCALLVANDGPVCLMQNDKVKYELSVKVLED